MHKHAHQYDDDDVPMHDRPCLHHGTHEEHAVEIQRGSNRLSIFRMPEAIRSSITRYACSIYCVVQSSSSTVDTHRHAPSGQPHRSHRKRRLLRQGQRDLDARIPPRCACSLTSSPT